MDKERLRFFCSPTVGSGRLLELERRSHRPPVDLPDAMTGNVHPQRSQYGTLSVMTPEKRVDSSGRPYDLPHELENDSSPAVSNGYAIYDPRGELVAEVPSHSDLVATQEGPTGISLPTGRYLMKLDRDAGGAKAFWVTIEARRHTEVDPSRLGGVRQPEAR